MRIAILGLFLMTPGQDVEWSSGSPTTDPDGVVHIPITSSAQSKPVELRLLAPPGPQTGDERRFLYILPVESEGNSRYGDGLAEARRLKLHEKYGWTLVAPGFAQLPWYADHPTDPKRRDETHLLKVLLPLVDQRMPAPKPIRLLVGFSKSGWGAWSLLLRHPELFRAAAAWDAPLMKEKPDQFGMDGAFVTQENFDGYRLTRLLREKADLLKDRSRLAHFGYGNFRDYHLKMSAYLKELGIPAEFEDGPSRDHTWGSGWMEGAARALDAMGR